MSSVLHTVASTRADHGGPSRSVPLLCEALSDEEVPVRLVTAAPSGKVDQSETLLPAPPVHTTIAEESGWLGRMLRAPLAFHKTLHDEAVRSRPTLIHDHGLWLPSNIAAAVVAWRQDVPLVVSTRGMLTAWSLRHHRWKKRLAWATYQKHVLRQASLFHVTSQEEVDALRDLGFEQPAAVIPNGVPLPEPKPEEQTPDDRQEVLFLSRLHPKKGLPMLLKAWDRVRPEGWTLKLVGPSENGHRGELERQVRRLELEKVVQFSGPVSDEEKWDVYRRADLFVLPTYSENFGIVVAEALAAGVPVIATTGAPWEDLEISDCGWWVEPTERALTTALKEAFALSPRERAAMGRRGRALVENHYSWQGVARRMIEAYQWRLDGGSRPEFIVEGTQSTSGMGSR